jgi:integrase
MLLPDEWLHLEDATAAVAQYGMPGAERVSLYRLAIETGLRANELRSLTRSSLVLDAEQPYIVAKMGSTKNRERAQQYIQVDLAESLRQHAACKTPSASLFALPPKWEMADMLREDLAAARKAWLDDARREPDELIRREQSDFLVGMNHAGEVLDFHSLRHTCGAWLVLAGVPLNVVQKVMRHSTITLTIDTYGHMLPGAEADAVSGLAKFFRSGNTEPVAAIKTGTDGAPVRKGAVYAQCAKQVSRKSHAGDTHETAEKVSPAGLEPTTYGLKVRCSTN